VRIALVTTSYPLRDGQAAGHFVASEARRLSTTNDVLVIAPGVDTEAEVGPPRVLRSPGRGLFGPPGVLSRLRERPLRAWAGVEFCWRARRSLEKEGPFDRVIAHWLLPCGWPILPGARGALEAVAHGSDVRLLAALPRVLRLRIARAWLDCSVQLRCVSRELQQELLACTSAALEPLTRVEPVAIDLGAAPDRAAARRLLGVASAEQLVLLVARLIPEKRVAPALRAVVLLPGVRVVVVGGGPLLEGLRREFPAVCFTGELRHPEALRWIAAADVLLSASWREGAPTALREARALGVPVVACEAGDLRERAACDSGVWLV
jgi:teichuronic acid biosynthesis glycosyltransferase TuaC